MKTLQHLLVLEASGLSLPELYNRRAALNHDLQNAREEGDSKKVQKVLDKLAKIGDDIYDLESKRKLREQDEDDDYNGDSYEREKKVSVLIVRAFLKCGLPVSEYEGYGGTEFKGQRYYVLYSEDDHEATVKLDEAELADLVKLEHSGLIDGKCEIQAASDGTIRLTFKVHGALHSGDAEID